MAAKTKRISTLIETQLPEFITNEYELFGQFVQKYYEQQEVQGGVLDIANNFLEYRDIDFYEKKLLSENDTLVTTISETDETVVLLDASSFPEKNGYVRINDEIIFYQERTGTELRKCSRGVSGNTTLGDLYDKSNFVDTTAASHSAGSTVHNISNLFLYAFVKSFENQYLGSFPEKYLKGEVDKRTLIKNIQKFYKSKGTSSSIKFIFNTIVAKDIENKPEVYNPKDFTLKSSESDWISVYALKCKVISGDPYSLVGKKIAQQETDEYGYADCTVDAVRPEGTIDGEQIYNIILAPETVNGSFGISTKTRLETRLLGSDRIGSRANVFSTLGWGKQGSVVIGSETIDFDEKNATQFYISRRRANETYEAGTSVYKPVLIEGHGVTLLTFGVVYNATTTDGQPFSSPGDRLQVSEPGFKTDDVKVVQSGTNTPRWITGAVGDISIPTSPQTTLDDAKSNVSAIFSDEQYYYIASSGYPDYNILDRSSVDETLLDQKLLRIIRKEAIATTERYATPASEVGILVNGVRVYGYKDPEILRFGKVERIDVNTRGRGYDSPPFVLLDGVPNKARAILIGQVVDRIDIIDATTVFTSTPSVEVTSGRGAEVEAVVTGGKVTSLKINNAGQYYSSPPTVVIRDKVGRGRFADYEAIVSPEGQITGFNQIAEGTLYTQQNIEVEIIPTGRDGTANAVLTEWVYDRQHKLKSVIDSDNGYYFRNYNPLLEYGYGHVANPRQLRVELGDNIDGAGSEPANKTHSPIIGFAYDGNPIYGSFGYEDPVDPQSPITRMTSSYSIKANRTDGPSVTEYPLGTFTNDYTYNHRSGSLDENNGRFTVTPEFPQGTYAYFITIDSNQVPQFPYILGDNFYSLPVDSNYNSPINQDDIPKNAKRLFQAGMPTNGGGLIANIAEVRSGGVEGVVIDASADNFSVNSQLYFDNAGTEGSEAEAIVSSVKGKPVNYLESKEDKVVRLITVESAYLFENDFLRQPASGAFGQIVGTVANDSIIVLRNVSGTFNNTGTFSADIKTLTLFLDQDSSYTKGAIVSLTDGINDPIATAEVLEGTVRQNSVTLKVLSGTWIIDDDYTIRSDDLFNTVGTKIVTIQSLSDNLTPFDVNQSVALIETSAPHGLGIGDRVAIDIIPDDVRKTKTYYVRKRLYQNVVFQTPRQITTIDYTGIGRFDNLNVGAFYTEGTYEDVPLTGGSGSGATADITVDANGRVSSLVLTNGGSGYAQGDYLGVDDDQLGRSGSGEATSSTVRLVLYLTHVGFASTSTDLIVKSSDGFAENDLIATGDEVLKITRVSGKVLTVERAQEGTTAIDHFNAQSVRLYKPRYHFGDNYQIGSGAGAGTIVSYDLETQQATIVYDYGIDVISASRVTISSTFFDAGTPARLAKVKSAETPVFKFEFSEDNTSFNPNPNVDVQEFYRYVFDTSHSSMNGVNFDISPSTGLTLLTLERTISDVRPGYAGAFLDVKFGFGPRLATNNYDTKVGTNFTLFYYYDKNGNVLSENSYLKLIDDPLQGTKTVNYVTSNRFVYEVDREPLWDGSGTISYTTTGQFAIGSINSASIINFGLNYKKAPTILGADVTADYRASATVLFDEAQKIITGIRIDEFGLNYSNPMVVVHGDGRGARFTATTRTDGSIFSIILENPGKGYTSAPTVDIIESDASLYVESSTIGVPQSVNIIQNGGAYHLDKTVSPEVSSQYTLALKNFSGDFKEGELVTQTINNVEVLRARVSEYRSSSNLLKIKDITGFIRKDVVIEGKVSRASGTVKTSFVSVFDTSITSFYDNSGYYNSDRGRLSIENQKITDSFFYQDYSYVVKSKTSIEQWRDLIKSTTHPAGFKLFGHVDIETDQSAPMPSGDENRSSSFTTIELWDPQKNTITSDHKVTKVTNTIIKVENSRIRKAIGSAASSEFNFNEMTGFSVSLFEPFNGVLAEDYIGSNPPADSGVIGRDTFQLLDDNNQPFVPASAENLIVTLDGILQEPGVAYTVIGDAIIFAQPPLGPYQKFTGALEGDVTYYEGTKFNCRYITLKDSQYNDRFFRKTRNIFQRNGRWLDSANQIERNREFIVAESVGYGRSAHPTLDWSTKTDDYQDNIRYLLEAYEHDLRFGGNVKITSYAEVIAEFDYIKSKKTESLDIFSYAKKLANLAIRNWDLTQDVQYFTGSRLMTVANSDDLAIGMYVSSGRSFTTDTQIVEIVNETTVRLNKAALQNSGGGGGASATETSLDGTTNGNVILPSSIGVVEPGNQYQVSPGDTVQVPTSFASSSTATFIWSNVNNGTFYDASNLIAANKEHIQNEVSNFTFDQFSLPGVSEEKCKRDIGYLVDAIVYHLRYGGNANVVEFASLYYTFNKYPYGEELTYLGGTLATELIAAEYAWNLVGTYCVNAMRNSLASPTYPGSPDPVVDNDVSTDNQFPACVEVENAINTYIDIVQEIIDNGPGAVEIVKQNENKRGNWTPLTTFSNPTIIPDPELTENECSDVVSSMNSLFGNIDDVINSNSYDVARPDYIDGEETVFDLYWSDGTPVVTEKDENLLITINAVLQQTKYNADYPGGDAYYIDKSSTPNKLIFDVAPIWDQDLGAKGLGEPTAVEKVIGHGVGNYKRLTIDQNLIDNSRSGPFLMLDLEDLTVQNVEDSDFLLVFIDSVLQQPGKSYTVSGPNIQFTFPITEQMKVDLRYLYGRDVGSVLNLYDYDRDRLLATGHVTLDVASNLDIYKSKFWKRDLSSDPIIVTQRRADQTINTIGILSNEYYDGDTFEFDIRGNKAEIDTNLSLDFSTLNNLNYTIGLTLRSATIDYEVDNDGRVVLRSDDQAWAGTNWRFTYKTPFVSLTNGDLIRIDGQNRFRRIKNLPTKAISSEQRPQQPVSHKPFATVDIERYNGITRGEGLAVVATIENGSVVDLTWNQRSYEPITQPTAYQYYTAPVLNFIPKDGNGGGARAQVLVSKGQVISVELIDGGSGYTQAPDIVVARRFEVLSDRDIAVSLISAGIHPQVDVSDRLSIISTVDILGNQVAGINSFTSILFNSPKQEATDDISGRRITSELYLDENVGTELTTSVNEIEITQNPFIDEILVVDIDAQTDDILTVVSGRVSDIVQTTITNERVNRQLTTTLHNVINNTSLSNINYYEVAAFLEVALDPTDSIVYIPDTSKFKTNGFLLIGDEVVRYMRKINDRFLMVQRGQDGTTAQAWPAGTYIRQIPDPVSIAPGGIIGITAESTITTVDGGSNIGGLEYVIERRYNDPVVTLNDDAVREITQEQQYQDAVNVADQVVVETLRVIPAGDTKIVSDFVRFSAGLDEIQTELQVDNTQGQFVVDKAQFEVLMITPPSGAVDGFEESLFFSDPIKLRDGTFLDLIGTTTYTVTLRDGTDFTIENAVTAANDYVGNYATTNAGPTLGNWYPSFDDGAANVSNITIGEFTRLYPQMTIADFTDRSESSYNKAGEYFNLANASIQNPVTTTQLDVAISAITDITVADTTYFPESGYLFTSQGALVQYTGKTDTSFTGVTFVSGPNALSAGDEIIPFTID